MFSHMHCTYVESRNLYAVSGISATAMASGTCKEEERHCLLTTSEGSCNLPASGSRFHLMKTNFNETLQHCSLDVPPILIEEAALPVAEKWPFHNACGQGVYSISVLPKEGNTSPTRTSHLAFLSFLEVPIPSKNEMCLDIQSNCRDYIDVQMENADAYSQCILDTDLEKETVKIPKSNNETARSTKSGALTKELSRQASLKSGGKLMQTLMTYGSMSSTFLFKDKASIERGLDTPNNRWRRYKRASPFDSRKIVIFFSILSSFGTLVLIYLTLRVREAAQMVT